MSGTGADFVCVFGNAGRKLILVSITYAGVELLKERHGNGQIAERVTGTLPTALYFIAH